MFEEALNVDVDILSEMNVEQQKSDVREWCLNQECFPGDCYQIGNGEQRTLSQEPTQNQTQDYKEKASNYKTKLQKSQNYAHVLNYVVGPDKKQDTNPDSWRNLENGGILENLHADKL